MFSVLEEHLTFFRVTPCLMADIRLLLGSTTGGAVLGAGTFLSWICPRCNEANTSSIVPTVKQHWRKACTFIIMDVWMEEFIVFNFTVDEASTSFHKNQTVEIFPRLSVEQKMFLKMTKIKIRVFLNNLYSTKTLEKWSCVRRYCLPGAESVHQQDHNWGKMPPLASWGKLGI